MFALPIHIFLCKAFLYHEALSTLNLRRDSGCVITLFCKSATAPERRKGLKPPKTFGDFFKIIPENKLTHKAIKPAGDIQ